MIPKTLLCDNPLCRKPLKNDLYGSKCEDCWAMNTSQRVYANKDYAENVRERLKKEGLKDLE